MSIALIKYIKKNGLQSLIDKFAIRTKHHTVFQNLVLLKYDQINTPINDITRDCRGIILDENDNWNIVCYTYKRFANYGETWGDEVDFSTVKVYEKLDGSLCQLYYYNDEWHIATSGTPDGSGEVRGTNITFAELFWKVWSDLNYQLPANTNKCFAFELCTPYNRIVVRHKESDIVLHGVRDLDTLNELNPIIEAHNNNWKCVKTFSFQSWEDVKSASNNLDPMEDEGYVVCDANYNRAKVKSLAYVNVAHMKDGFTTRHMLEIVRTNENSEFLLYYPEYIELYNEISDKYERMVGEIKEFYETIKDIDNRKQFATMATTQKYSGILFGLKFGKIKSIKESLANMNIKYLEKWLNIKSVPV